MRVRLFRNSLYNLLGFGLPLLAAVITIPILIETLGTERFGILTLIWALVSYFGLFDLGLGRALTQQLARSWARGEQAEAERLITTALAATAVLGVGAGVLLAAGADWSVRQLGGLSNPDETVEAIYWMSAALPFVIVTSTLRGVLEARSAFGVINAIRLPLGLYTFLAPLAVVHYWENDLASIAIALALGRLIAFVVHLGFCRRLTPAVAGWAGTDSAALRKLLRSGGWMTVSNVISPLMGYLDRFVIGLTISVSAVAYYAAPYELITKLWIVPGALTAVLFPRFSRAPVQGLADAEALFRRSVLLLFVLLYPVTLGIALFAQELISLWLSAEFASQSYRILQVFAFGILLNCLAHVPFTFLQAMGRPKSVATIHLFEFPVYLLVLWIGAEAMGLLGIALAWLLRMVVDSALMFYFSAAGSKYGVPKRVEWKPPVLLLLTVGSFAGLFIIAPGARILTWSIAVSLVYLFCWNLLLSSTERAALLKRVSYVAG